MELKGLRDWPDRRVKCQAFEQLAFGVLPFEQWMPVFANEAFREWPGLRSKCFAVWFPTMLDFLKGADERRALASEADRRQLRCGALFLLAEEIDRSFRDILALYSRDDQIFLRDRRLQNVHGRLHIYRREKHELDWFDGASSAVVKAVLTADEYRAILAAYYDDMGRASLELLDRLLTSQHYKTFSAVYRDKLVVTTHLLVLAQALDIT